MKPLVVYEAKAGQSHLQDALRDLREGIQRHVIWRELVRRDLYNRTKGASLGRWWIVIGQAIAIAGIGFVYANLFNVPLNSYLPYLATGLVTWGYIVSLINEASDVFVFSKGYLTQTRLPLSICVFRFVTRNMLLFAYKSSIIVATLLVFQVPVGWTAPLALVGVLLIAAAGFFTGVILGLLNARYRDIGQLVTSLTVFLFFVTPVFWRPDRLGDFSWIVDYNPLFHFVSLVRSPLLGDPIDGWSFMMTGGTIAVLALIASLVYKFMGREVIYWL
ncbi:ABC transporter permease [Hyphomicrobium sp.]|uniref:ABC transporter permease n=1 Tax=Hyphomicrobium sp. TaxID=82 RepID=UPI0025B8E64C|nr:ABC transporter permease [Hyphomicrobium sp.]MCC7253455.1 ABC transporter permease [Hyphomicrobium sp.]